jgi:SHS2 domain-containing protein
MKRFEIVPHAAGVSVRVFASTKAGLAMASLQGMFAAAAPRFVNGEALPVERPFKVESRDFGALLVDVLREAISSAAANEEGYEDIRFNLITDTKAEGAFIGRPVKSYGTVIKAAKEDSLLVDKNEKGEWETTVVLNV